MDYLNDEFRKMVDDDIRRIDTVISTGNQESRWELFRELDGRYQVCVSDFYRGMWESSNDGTTLWINRLKEKPEYLLDNLKFVKAKLTALRFGANATNNNFTPSTQVNVNNSVNVEVSFEQVAKDINNMTALTEEETKEILNRIQTIETIVQSADPKKQKWERIKPMLVWLADKSFDVGMTLLPLILKVK